MKPRLHIFGLPHTVTSPEYSHCAFTGKVLRFPRMMQSVGYEVYHYGVGSENHSGATKHIEIMTVEEQQKLAQAKYDPTSPKFVGDLANVGNDLYKGFNQRLREDCLKPNLESARDIFCLAFGHGHHEGVAGFPNTLVETGIGYPVLVPNSKVRVYESQAWLHWHLGKGNRAGCDYEFVIPNYFDPLEWEVRDVPEDGYWLYFGRIDPIKGVNIVEEIAKHRPDQRFVICGQGDAKPYLKTKNIEYHNPVHGLERVELYAGAKGVLMPTRYVEPFGGVTIEAQLCGRPVLGSVFGSFTETIDDGHNGFHCRVLGDYLAAMEQIEQKRIPSPRAIGLVAIRKYSMYELAPKYDYVFDLTDGLWEKGRDWYTMNSRIGTVTRAIVPT